MFENLKAVFTKNTKEAVLILFVGFVIGGILASLV